jgi:hypothetical protein
MTAAPMTFPGSRVLLGWWRELAGLSPRRLWFAHLLLHRVEALVEAVADRPLDALTRGLLVLLARSGPTDAHRLAAALAVDRPLLAELLGNLEAAGLACSAEGIWRATPAGQSAALRPTEPVTEPRRRSFYFVDAPEPAFVPLAPAATTPLMPPPGWSFDLGVLDACVRRPAGWKAERGFPADVTRLVHPANLADEGAWRAVPLDRAEQALLVLIEREGRLIGLPVQADSWSLGREPALSLSLSAIWFDPGGADAWRQAWQVWCQQRSLPAAEVDSCHLELDGHRLRVRAPGRLVERLRAQRSDAVKGEAWLMAGADRVRGVARLDLEVA